MRKQHLTLALALGFFLLGTLPTVARAATCSTIKVAAPSGAANDITFTFDAPYTCGTYANGDPWVQVSSTTQAVRITAITPARGAGLDGWNVNPSSTSAQPYDSRIDGYDAAGVPALPYDAKAGKLRCSCAVDHAASPALPLLILSLLLGLLARRRLARHANARRANARR